MSQQNNAKKIYVRQLTEQQIKQFDGIAEGLDLNQAANQRSFVEASQKVANDDAVLEYLVLHRHISMASIAGDVKEKFARSLRLHVAVARNRGWQHSRAQVSV